MSITLKTVVFLGSARNVIPPWGGDARLGDRVVNWVKSALSLRSSQLGEDKITHDVYIIDPIEVFSKDDGALSYSGGELSAPTFFMGDKLPEKAKALQDIVRNADCYLIISPEYNHSIPPALSSVMGHFGGSLYKCKPSGIVTYSPSPFAGMRAAMAIQIMCHELGCLPVSKLCGIGTVSDILEVDGTPKDKESRMLKQLPELLTQLEWMAVAMKNQRYVVCILFHFDAVSICTTNSTTAYLVANVEKKRVPSKLIGEIAIMTGKVDWIKIV